VSPVRWTKTFALADVPGTITGKLPDKIDDIYQVSNFMAGKPAWVHQFQRAAMEIRPIVACGGKMGRIPTWRR
jgi:hypothetical protein